MDIVPWIRRQVNPVPRVAISKALSNPSSYLGCNCCSANGQESENGLSPTMPDICIAFKLHTECGRLINLYDWMTSFNCVLKKVCSYYTLLMVKVEFLFVLINTHLKDDEDDSEEIEPIVQARFIRSVAQLQLLGFIQSSKRKTDHVARLTWGV